MASRWRIVLAASVLAPHHAAIAQTITDPAASKAASEARESAAKADKAEAEAATAEAEAKQKILKAQLGGLADVATEGNTTAAAGSGTIEATILASHEARTSAQNIIEDICTAANSLCNPPETVASARAVKTDGKPNGTDPAPAPASPAPPAPPPPEMPVYTACSDLTIPPGPVTPKLYIFTETEKPVFDMAETVQAALCGVDNKLKSAIAKSDNTNQSGTGEPASAMALFTLATTAAKLFRSDYSFQGLTVSSDDLLLAKLVASGAGTRIRVPVHVPSLYRNAAMSASSPLMAAVRDLGTTRNMAAARVAGHRAKAADYTKKKNAAKAKAHSEAATQLEAAVKLYDDYLAKITAASDKGVTELAEAARQSMIRRDLASGSYLLTLKMNAAGGNAYTKKNFWTFLGGPPFYVSGGALTSYTLFDGRTGAVLKSGSYGGTSPFKKIGHISRN